MIDGSIAKCLKCLTLAVFIFLAGGDLVAAQQTLLSKDTKAAEIGEGVFPLPTLDQIKSSRAEAEAATDLSESDKKNLLSMLDRGIRFLEETERLMAEILKIDQTLATAPSRIEKIKTELNMKTPDPSQIINPTVAKRMTNTELEQQEREEKASLAALRENLNNRQNQLEALKARPEQLQQEKNRHLAPVAGSEQGAQSRPAGFR